jgi:hypothetical protein
MGGPRGRHHRLRVVALFKPAACHRHDARVFVSQIDLILGLSTISAASSSASSPRRRERQLVPGLGGGGQCVGARPNPGTPSLQRGRPGRWSGATRRPAKPSRSSSSAAATAPAISNNISIRSRTCRCRTSHSSASTAGWRRGRCLPPQLAVGGQRVGHRAPAYPPEIWGDPAGGMGPQLRQPSGR